MADAKPWRSVADQLAQLQARGMHIGDVAKATGWLGARGLRPAGRVAIPQRKPQAAGTTVHH